MSMEKMLPTLKGHGHSVEVGTVCTQGQQLCENLEAIAKPKGSTLD